MKSYPFLFWAYTVVWIGIAAYVLFLFLRLRRLGARLDRLERRLETGTGQRDRPEAGVR